MKIEKKAALLVLALTIANMILAAVGIYLQSKN